MKKLLLLITYLLSSVVSFAQYETFVEGEVMVLLETGLTMDRFSAKLAKHHDIKIQSAHRLAQSMNLWLLKCSDYPSSTSELLDEVYRSDGVLIAQLNHTNLELRNTPNDPDFVEQWALYNDGSNGGSGQADIDALDAWDISTGGNTDLGDTIVVAVIDGGINIEHEDLQPNIFTNHNEIPGNGVDDDSNGYIDDVHGWNTYNNSGQHYNDSHGSHVAGIIGADGDNGLGVAGVNWNVKIMPISGSSVLESTVVAAYSYVLDMRKKYNATNGQQGAYVVAANSSFGINMGDPEDYPIWCAMYDSLGFSGVLSAGATANVNVNVDEVGDMPTACGSNFLLSVTNTTSSDIRNSGAAYGATTIDLGAPGTNIYSTLSSGYGDNSGTSMATPHVAGAIALMYNALCLDVLTAFQNNPGGLALYIKNKMMTEGVDELLSLSGLTVSGGRLNLRKAVESVADSCLSINFISTDASCGSCNGNITATVVGAEPPIDYYWSNGATNANTISNLCAGTYTLTVVDANNDSIVASTAVSDSMGPVVSVTQNDVNCPGGNDGNAVLSGAENYLWPDGNGGASRSDLTASTYFVTATAESSSCTTIVAVHISQPQSFSVTETVILPSPLSSASNGSVVLNVMGGTPPYAYNWSNGDDGFEVYQLTAGTYTITITDDNGCSYLHTVLVDVPEGQIELGGNAIQLYPNPASQSFNLSTLFSSGFNYVLFDLSGREVIRKSVLGQAAVVDVSKLNPGFYVIEVFDQQESYFRKLEVIR